MENTIMRPPKDRELFFCKQVNQESIGELSKKLVEIIEDDKQLMKNAELMNFTYEPKPIRIYIDSYGGTCYQGFGLISIIESSTTPIHTICTGCAMSMGFMILISGHKRFAHKYSTPLYHQVSGGAFGKLDDMKESVKEARRLQEMIDEIVLDKTDIKKKKLKKIFKRKKDWFMDAKKALELNVVDEIIK
jgi:ATP-dependent Clp protease protease subunit